MTEAPTGEGRACGKVILFGEHAVVYGVPAIAAGIDRGAVARAHRSSVESISINGKTLAEDDALRRALHEARVDLGLDPCLVELDLALPAGAGLGASAAMGVATVRAMGNLYERELGERQVFRAAQAWERVFHGNPSGIDVAAAQQARPIRFSKATEPEALLINKPLRLVVAQAGPSASTKAMVEGVARLKDRNPAQFQKTLDAIEALVENAHLLLRSGDLAAVGKLMDLNQMLLAGWMLSTEDLENACRKARDEGALGAKLTGSGGGGCVIALAGQAGQPEAEERASRILAAWKKAELPCFAAEVGGNGAPS